MSLLLEVIWQTWRKLITLPLAFYTVYSYIAENHVPGLGTLSDHAPALEWWVWLLILVSAWSVNTFVLLCSKTRMLRSDPNWVFAYQARIGKLPTLPSSLLPLINGGYVEGKSISKSIQPQLRPSLQQWNRLTEDNQCRYLQLLDWLGHDSIEFMQHLRNTAPPEPSEKQARLHFREQKR